MKVKRTFSGMKWGEYADLVGTLRQLHTPTVPEIKTLTTDEIARLNAAMTAARDALRVVDELLDAGRARCAAATPTQPA